MKNFIDFLKLPPRILGALTIASGLLLFFPDAVLTKLYMIDFRNKYGFALGITFVVSASILLVIFAVKITKSIIEKRDSKKIIEAQTKFLKRLKGDKVEFIREMIQEPTHTAMLPMHDGLVIEMNHYHVISPAGQTHMVNMIDPEINYFLQPWVIERIDEDEELQKKYL